jgi:hypothetical protein
VSAVPNAAAIVRRIWVPELDAGYDPQGLAVAGGSIYVSAYHSDSLGVRKDHRRPFLTHQRPQDRDVERIAA